MARPLVERFKVNAFDETTARRRARDIAGPNRQVRLVDIGPDQCERLAAVGCRTYTFASRQVVDTLAS